MMATAAIPFDGKTLNLYGVQKYFEHEDREVRKAAVKAYSDFYHGNEKRLEEIWDELIKIRTQMGKILVMRTLSRLDICSRDVPITVWRKWQLSASRCAQC